MSKKLIVANWKMHNSFDESSQWLKKFIAKYDENYEIMQNVDIVVCPPVFLIDYLDGELLNNAFEKLETFMFEENKKIEDFLESELESIIASERPILLGSQDCHHEDMGSFTGDISAAMIKDLGADFIMVGHSERRAAYKESDETIAKKAEAVGIQELVPIVCVGESREVRNQKGHLEFVYRQLMASVPRASKFSKLVIAYEPIWSIGTGLVATTTEIREMMKLLRKIVKEKLPDLASEFILLYGGSVNAENAQEILSIENVDGLLVGKASLDAEKFFDICLEAVNI